MNLDDYLPPHPILPWDRFWFPIRIFRHAVIPLLPFSEEAVHDAAALPTDGNFDAVTDEEIDHLRFTHFNVGLVCGKLSGVTVLEVTTHSAQIWMAEQDLPATPQWLGRRSRCYLFDYVADALPDPITEVRPGLRLLNDGAHVVYPGSIYDDGRLVYWEESPDWAEVADLPEWLLPTSNVVTLPA